MQARSHAKYAVQAQLSAAPGQLNKDSQLMAAMELLDDLELALDSLETSVEIMPVLKELQDLASHQIEAWTPSKFESIVDLLVRWHVDLTTYDSVRDRIAEVMMSFNTLWAPEGQFGQHILECLTADMEQIVFSQDPRPLVLDTLTPLLSCFHVIVESLVNHAPANLDRFSGIQSRMVAVILSTHNLPLPILALSTHILISLSSHNKHHFLAHQPDVLLWVLDHLSDYATSESGWPDIVTDLTLLVETWSPLLNPHVTEFLVDTRHLFLQLRWMLPSGHQDRVPDILNVAIKSLLSTEYAAAIQAPIAELLANEIEDVYSALALEEEDPTCQDLLSLVNTINNRTLEETSEEDIYSMLEYSSSFLLSVATFDALLLSCVARLSDFQANDAFAQLARVFKSFSAPRSAVMFNTLKDIAHEQRYFVSSTIGGLHLDDISQGSPLGITMDIFRVVSNNWSDLSTSVKNLSLSWMCGLLNVIEELENQPTSAPHLQSAFVGILERLLINSGVDNDDDIRADIAHVFRSYSQAFGSMSLGPGLRSMIAERTTDISPGVSTAWKEILFGSNPFGFALNCNSLHETEVARKLKVLYMKSPNQGLFRYFHFSAVLQRLDPSTTSEDKLTISDTTEPDDGDWLRRIYYACQGNTILSRMNTDSGPDALPQFRLDLAQNSGDFLYSWAIWEAARYCMLSRLRTPYGGPQQTFEALEKMVRQFLDGPNSERMLETGGLRRLQDVIRLIDRLELQIYIASSGSSVGILPAAPKSSALFFRTNKKVCDDWLTRVRPQIIRGAIKAGEYELSVRHGYVLLAEMLSNLKSGVTTEMITWMDDFEVVLVHLVESLTALGDSDAIVGLHSWCKRNLRELTKPYSSKHKKSKSDKNSRNKGEPILREAQAAALSQMSIEWINIGSTRTQFQYEQAALEATNILRATLVKEEGLDPSPSALYMARQITDCLSDIYSYEQLCSFLETIPIESYSDPTAMWSDPKIHDSLEAMTSGDAPEAWSHLSEFSFHSTTSRNETTLTLESSSVYGQHYLFLGNVLKAVDLPRDNLESHRLSILESMLPAAEYLIHSEHDHARAICLDALMLGTPVNNMANSVAEFMQYISKIPQDQIKMFLHKDLRFWTRMDTMINLVSTKEPVSNAKFQDQANSFKLLMSKVARHSSCHGFVRRILRTWEGPRTPEIQFEEAKAAMDSKEYSVALTISNNVLKQVDGLLLNQADDNDSSQIPGFKSKVLLKLAKWARSTKPALNDSHLQMLESILDMDLKTIAELPQTRIENITAECLKTATEVDENHRESWFEFGTYHYKQGWGILDDLGSMRQAHPIAKAAYATLRQVIQTDDAAADEELTRAILCIFVKHCASAQPFDTDTTFDVMEGQLERLLDDSMHDKVSLVLDFLRDLLDTILQSYRLSVEGYFRFLQLSDHKPCKDMSMVSDEEDSTASDDITATLRLLRLLAKHGCKLLDIYSTHFENAKIEPWTNIIPQLFARLDHPEPPIQNLIANLLSRIGQHSPQLIVFHVIVGASSDHGSATQKLLLLSITRSLQQAHPDLVAQVTRMIQELEKVTVLWEEKWHKKLGASLPELRDKLQMLLEQYRSLSEGDQKPQLPKAEIDSLMNSSYSQAIQPVLRQFDALREKTSDPQSNHERWFATQYLEFIDKALGTLSAPPSWSAMLDGFVALKDIFGELSKKLSGPRTLRLSDISPGLASIRRSMIDIPGQSNVFANDGSHDGGIKIQSFDEQVIVIPTKTRPKKLILVGSNGQKYPYLFKGLEDLHLDERVMQLLRITNGMFRRDKASSLRNLSARHYVVIPLSDNSGMIQWVENTISVYSLVHKWQYREALVARWVSDDAAASAAAAGAVSLNSGQVGANANTNINTNNQPNAPPGGIPRATDVYYEKATRVLQKLGLAPQLSRRHWPKSVLVELYNEMAAEIPADLLEREIWASSPTPAEWWKKSTTFARSTAVMSMIGYVIGLGDRHLDNILMDFTTGDLVHIDYNVCFEKGKQLRIPEVVPFRLSRNILTSFGVTGVEGHFRIGCEQAMKVMRKNKEILVTLLEAFVYDPLVDWHIEAPTNNANNNNHSSTNSTRQYQQRRTGGDQESSVGKGKRINKSRHHDDNHSNEDAGQDDEDEEFVREEDDVECSNGLSSLSLMGAKTESEPNSSVSLATTNNSNSTRTLNGHDQSSSSSSLRYFQSSGRQPPPPPTIPLPPLPPSVTTAPPTTTATNATTGNSNQRNAYAVNILRGVRHKLEGRDFDTSKKFKVAEQVDRVIQEAVNVENLASMYEGWTSWI